MFGRRTIDDMAKELAWLDAEIGHWEDCLVRVKRAPRGMASRVVAGACKDGLGRMRRARAKLAVKFDHAKDAAKPADVEDDDGMDGAGD